MKRRDFNKGVALVPATSVLVPFTRVAPVASAAAAVAASEATAAQTSSGGAGTGDLPGYAGKILARLENLWVILGLFRCWLSEFQEPVEASAGGIKGALLRFGGVVDEGATVIGDSAGEHLPHGLFT